MNNPFDNWLEIVNDKGFVNPAHVVVIEPNPRGGGVARVKTIHGEKFHVWLPDVPKDQRKPRDDE